MLPTALRTSAAAPTSAGAVLDRTVEEEALAGGVVELQVLADIVPVRSPLKEQVLGFSVLSSTFGVSP